MLILKDYIIKWKILLEYHPIIDSLALMASIIAVSIYARFYRAY